MTDRAILNELRLTLEFLERRALDPDGGMGDPPLREELRDRAEGLRPVVKAVSERAGH